MKFSKSYSLIAALVVIATGVLILIVHEPSRRDRRTPDTPVILISVDTLRPDHLGCYGYSRRTSPAVDHLAAEGVLFESAIAQAPSTLPSHASMLTACIPSHHGAFHSALAGLSSSVTTLAEILSKNGYRTAAFHGGGQLSEVFGLDRGFELYDQARSDNFRFSVRKGIEWLRRIDGEPFFLFLHTYETHVPYQAERKILRRFEPHYAGELPDTITMDLLDQYNFNGKQLSNENLDHIVSVYDSAVFDVDRSMGRLIHFLKDEGLYDRVLIVFTSDHGEEFMERSKVGYHCHTVYDELIRVPLVMKLPDFETSARIIQQQVRSIDIMPTVLDFLRISHPLSVDGVSLLPLIREGREEQHEQKDLSGFALSERDDLNGEHHIASIRSADEKLYVIRKNGTIVQRYLFDLRSDAAETRNIINHRSGRAESLWGIYRTILHSRDIPELRPIGLDGETKAELKALGYLRDQ